MAIAVAVAAVSLGAALDAEGGLVTVNRCCLMVKAAINGTISADFGRDPNAPLSGRRDFTWSATVVGKYRYTNLRRPLRAAPHLEQVGPSRAKFGTSEIGDIASNPDSPEPPRQGRVSVHKCEERATSGGKWLTVGSNSGQGVELARQGKKVLMEVTLPGPSFHLPETVFTGDCDGVIYSHNDHGESDGLPLREFLKLDPPAPLNKLRAPSVRKLKEAGDFSKTYRYSASHGPEREPENARHHTTIGKNTLEVTFRYVKG